jgi:hypothetical protein
MSAQGRPTAVGPVVQPMLAGGGASSTTGSGARDEFEGGRRGRASKAMHRVS